LFGDVTNSTNLLPSLEFHDALAHAAVVPSHLYSRPSNIAVCVLYG
jgi:hypothetical protein